MGAEAPMVGGGMILRTVFYLQLWGQHEFKSQHDRLGG